MWLNETISLETNTERYVHQLWECCIKKLYRISNPIINCNNDIWQTNLLFVYNNTKLTVMVGNNRLNGLKHTVWRASSWVQNCNAIQVSSNSMFKYVNMFNTIYLLRFKNNLPKSCSFCLSLFTLHIVYYDSCE